MAALAMKGVSVRVYSAPASEDAPFTATAHDDVDFVVGQPSVDGVRRWGADALIVSGWHRSDTRRVARSLDGQAVRAVTIDHQWAGSLRQWLGVATSDLYLHRHFDVALVAGNSQRDFARRLGFEHRRIWSPLYSADVDAFRDVGAGTGQGFAFVGRAVEDKGLDLLLEAYDRYAQESRTPWPLTIFGTGPLLARAQESRATIAGFVQPGALPAALSSHAALVLPSRFEPWGVVVHEAAAAGLGLVLSDRVGAAERFLIDGANGFRVPPTVDGVLSGLRAYAGLSVAELARAAGLSRSLAATVTPDLWADNLLANIRRWTTS